MMTTAVKDEKKPQRIDQLLALARDGIDEAIDDLWTQFGFDYRSCRFTEGRKVLDREDGTDLEGGVSDKTGPENTPPDEKLLAHYAFMDARFVELMEKADLGDPDAMDALKFDFLYDYRLERAAEAYENIKEEKAEASHLGGDRGDLADLVDVGGDL